MLKNINRAIGATPRGMKHFRKEIWQLLNLGIGIEKTSIFIVGAQRSGTSMTLNIFDKSPYTKRYGETRSGLLQHISRLNQKDIERRNKRTFASHLVYKPLTDSHFIDQYLANTPNSRAIWIYRNFHDTASSAVKKWRGGYLNMVRQISADKHYQEQSGLDDWPYERLAPETIATVKQHYHDDLNQHEGALLFWYTRHSFFESLDLVQHPDVLLVKYEDLVQSPVPAFRRMFKFAGLPFEEHFVADVFQSSVGKKVASDTTPEIEELCQAMLSRLDTYYQASLQHHPLE